MASLELARIASILEPSEAAQVRGYSGTTWDPVACVFLVSGVLVGFWLIRQIYEGYEREFEQVRQWEKEHEEYRRQREAESQEEERRQQWAEEDEWIESGRWDKEKGEADRSEEVEAEDHLTEDDVVL